MPTIVPQDNTVPTLLRTRATQIVWTHHQHPSSTSQTRLFDCTARTCLLLRLCHLSFNCMYCISSISNSFHMPALRMLVDGLPSLPCSLSGAFPSGPDFECLASDWSLLFAFSFHVYSSFFPAMLDPVSSSQTGEARGRGHVLFP